LWSWQAMHCRGTRWLVVGGRVAVDFGGRRGGLAEVCVISWGGPGELWMGGNDHYRGSGRGAARVGDCGYAGAPWFADFAGGWTGDGIGRTAAYV